MKEPNQLTPERIQIIRKSLSLTQEEAGRILGGGPRAFTKYESGTLKPSAAVINLLRILEDSPGVLSVLKGEIPSPGHSIGFTPFEISGADIDCLKPEPLTQLLLRLLRAEAVKFGLPLDGISVPSNIYAADGGEDGRISWHNGPSRTQFLPSRLCQFQLKARGISPGQAAKDVLTNKDEIKANGQVGFKRGWALHYDLC